MENYSKPTMEIIDIELEQSILSASSRYNTVRFYYDDDVDDSDR